MNSDVTGRSHTLYGKGGGGLSEWLEMTKRWTLNEMILSGESQSKRHGNIWPGLGPDQLLKCKRRTCEYSPSQKRSIYTDLFIKRNTFFPCKIITL